MIKIFKLILMVVLSVAIVAPPVLAEDLSQEDIDSIYTDSVYYDNTDGPTNCSASASSDGGSVTLTGSDNIEKGYNFFRQKGFTPQQSAGIIGNFMQESHMNPAAQQDGSADKFPKDGVGFGIAQWTYSTRQQPLVNLAESRKVSPATLPVQLDYVWQELQGNYSDVVTNVKATSTVEDATRVFMGTPEVSGYENPGTPYLENRIEYAKQVLEKYGEGASTGGGTTDTPGAECTDGAGGLGINGDFVFPEKTTKGSIKKGSSGAVWCYNDQSNCHHDYNAADIFNKVGTTVVAAVSGEIQTLSNPSACDGWRGVPRMQIKGDDGMYYYYTHMQPGSLKVSGGRVSAGDELGKIGPTECAQGTAPHLHFQISKVLINNTEDSEERTQYVNPQPNLIAAYEKLPEN